MTDDATTTQQDEATIESTTAGPSDEAAAEQDAIDSEDEKRAVVLASGGMDSATATYVAEDEGFDLYLLHTSYGQNTADREFECARSLADAVDAVDFLHVETGHLAAIGASSLTDDELAVADADLDGDDDVPSSYVPFRNANLLAMATSYAEANDCDAIFIGAHSEDFSGYPDCRPEFFEAFQGVVDAGTKPDTDVEIRAPFVEWSKTDIAERGLELGVPYADTWSCYRENEPACGTCDACAFRLQAFQRLGERDPVEYAERPSYVKVD